MNEEALFIIHTENCEISKKKEVILNLNIQCSNLRIKFHLRLNNNKLKITVILFLRY